MPREQSASLTFAPPGFRSDDHDVRARRRGRACPRRPAQQPNRRRGGSARGAISCGVGAGTGATRSERSACRAAHSVGATHDCARRRQGAHAASLALPPQPNPPRRSAGIALAADAVDAAGRDAIDAAGIPVRAPSARFARIGAAAAAFTTTSRLPRARSVDSTASNGGRPAARRCSDSARPFRWIRDGTRR